MVLVVKWRALAWEMEATSHETTCEERKLERSEEEQEQIESVFYSEKINKNFFSKR